MVLFVFFLTNIPLLYAFLVEWQVYYSVSLVFWPILSLVMGIWLMVIICKDLLRLFE